MSQLNVEDKRYRSESHNYGIYEDRSKVEMEVVGESAIGFVSVELINSVSGNCSSGTGVGARTIAGADDVALLQVKAPHLALMDCSTVVSTRGGSGKGLDLSLLSLPIMSDDAHRVSSFDLFHILPADLMAGKWIDDHDSLVVEDNRGVKEDLIGQCASKERPGTRNYATSKSIIKEIHVGKCGKEEESQEGEDVRARRSEELAISHEEIFSCVREMRAA